MKDMIAGKRVLAAIGAALLLTLATGCASKKYVRNQTAPIVQHTNELEDQAAANHRNIGDVNTRAQQGIEQAKSAASAADQKALAAGQSATQAQQAAQDALNHADSLASLVGNLDTYHQVASTEVHFGFNKDTLTPEDKQELDTFAQQLGNTKSYILEITGGTDSVGNKAYNYQLSERRAENVAQYLASKYKIPAHKFYLIGIGKDVEVASNRDAKGRAKNRRVQVQLLSNAPQTGNSAEPGGQQGAGDSNAPAAQGQSTPQPAPQTTPQPQQ